MVDFVTKPIDCERMVEVLGRHARAGVAHQAETAPTSAVPEPAAPGKPLVDWPALRERYASKPEFLQHLLETAINSLKATPGNLRSALLASDGDRVIFLLHSLKGVAGTLAAGGLAKQASEAELACRSRSAGADRLAAEVADDAERLAAEIRAQIEARREAGVAAQAQGHQGSRAA